MTDVVIMKPHHRMGGIRAYLNSRSCKKSLEAARLANGGKVLRLVHKNRFERTVLKMFNSSRLFSKWRRNPIMESFSILGDDTHHSNLKHQVFVTFALRLGLWSTSAKAERRKNRNRFNSLFVSAPSLWSG